MDRTGSGLLERSELCEGLASFGLDADDGPGGDVDKVMDFFDHDGGGRISIRELHRGLRVRSSYTIRRVYFTTSFSLYTCCVSRVLCVFLSVHLLIILILCDNVTVCLFVGQRVCKTG